MNALIISCVYPPEPMVSAKTSYDVAHGLLRANHKVSVITTQPNRPAGILYAGYIRQLFHQEKTSDNLLVLRLFSFFSPRSRLLSRWLENLSFGVMTGIALFFIPKPDVIYCNTWPILATGIVRLITGLRRIPLVVSVQDLYPESIFTQGRLSKENMLYRFMMHIDRWVAQGSAKMIVISEAFARAYCEERGLSVDKIAIIPNWVDANAVQVLDRTIYREEVGIPDKAFVMTYGGNVGVAAGVEGLIEACRELRSGRETWLVVAGSGSQVTACQDLARTMKTVQVHFHSPWETAETSKVLASADVLVLPTRGKQTLASVPSKLMSYLLAGRPVLAQALPGTDTARVIEEARCGWVVPPDDSAALTTKLAEICRLEKTSLDDIGARGREYALAHFTKEANLPKVVKIIRDAIK